MSREIDLFKAIMALNKRSLSESEKTREVARIISEYSNSPNIDIAPTSNRRPRARLDQMDFSSGSTIYARPDSGEIQWNNLPDPSLTATTTTNSDRLGYHVLREDGIQVQHSATSQTHTPVVMDFSHNPFDSDEDRLFYRDLIMAFSRYQHSFTYDQVINAIVNGDMFTIHHMGGNSSMGRYVFSYNGIDMDVWGESLLDAIDRYVRLR